jgi:hypothetical protein
MSDREMISDLLSALEYHAEQTRPIHSTTTAIQAAREHLRKAAPAPVARSEPTAFITPLMEQQMFDDWCPYRGSPDPRVVWAAAVDAVNEILLGAAPAPVTQPIDMVLNCPACGLQHIDAPDPINGDFETDGGTPEELAWDNPPHRSHLCRDCGHIWRPADVPTNGVAAIKTKGKADSPIAAPAPVTQPLTIEQIAEVTGSYPASSMWRLIYGVARAIERAHGITGDES